MPQNLRELVDARIAEFSDIDSLGPTEVAKKLVELSAIWASINKECSDRLFYYKVKANMCLKDHNGVAAGAKVEAEASPEFQSWLEAETYKKSVQEVIRAVKYYLRNASEEKREGIY